MENTPPKKFDLQENNTELKLYIHTVQPGMVAMVVPEDFKLTMGYTDQQAIEEIRKEYPQGNPFTINKKGQIDLRKVLERVNIQTEQAQVLQPILEAPPSKAKKLENFINSTMLLADEYVKDEKKKATIKKILSEIKLNEDEPNSNQGGAKNTEAAG